MMFSIKNGISSHYSWFMMGFSRRGEFPRTDLCIFQQENDLMDIVVVGLKILIMNDNNNGDSVAASELNF